MKILSGILLAPTVMAFLAWTYVRLYFYRYVVFWPASILYTLVKRWAGWAAKGMMGLAAEAEAWDKRI